MSESQPVILVIQGELHPGTEDLYAKYIQGTHPLMAEYQVEVVAVGAGVETSFSTTTWPVNGMLMFPSRDAAERFLSDPRYLEIKHAYRDKTYRTLHLTFFAPRPPVRSAPTSLEVAETAFSRFRHGLATGEWDAFFEMLTDDFEFWFPQGKFHGLNQGKSRAIEFFSFVRTVYPEGLFATLDRVVGGNGATVMFEFRDEGLMFGQPYKNRVAVAFDVQGDKIRAYREYFGSDGKSN